MALASGCSVRFFAQCDTWNHGARGSRKLATWVEIVESVQIRSVALVACDMLESEISLNMLMKVDGGMIFGELSVLDSSP